MKPIKTKQLGEVWIANQGDMSAIGATEQAAINGVKDCARTQPATLQPPHTAPKDGTIILGDFNWPWMLTAAWNEYDEKWAVSMPQSCPMEGGKVDTYWETDQEEHSDLKGWLPMPDHIETDELGLGWDWTYSTDDVTEAFRLASEITKSWQMRGDDGKIRIIDRNGNEF